MARRVTVAFVWLLALTGSASAQSGSSGTSAGQSTQGSQTPSSSTATAETRPATTTFFGDTGLWFAPTAEVLPGGKWSVSGYRRGTNFIQGYTNVGDFAGTFAVGIKNRAEVFGSFLFDTRIDRDVYPLFVADPNFGGIIDRYPRVNQHWTGDNLGDFYVGGKFNLLSEYDQKPVALAVRGLVKLPTGKEDVGASTGKTDFAIDGIVSKEAAKLVEVTGFAGYEWRGKPDGFETASGAFRWGVGAGFPSRGFIRGTAELNGFAPSSDTTTMLSAPEVRGADLTFPPLVSNTENLTRTTLAITAQSKKGIFGGVGLSWNLPRQQRNAAFSDADPTADYWDWQVRIGYHPGVRTYVPPPPPPPPPPPAPAPQNRPPTVRARCEPCTVEVGRTSTVTADAQDPDGDTLTYRWSAPTGTFQNAADRQTPWT